MANPEEAVEKKEQEATPTTEPVVPETTEKKEEPKAESSEPSKPANPDVIVKKERGFSHYVGFALLTVLTITFFFLPGISIAYLINKAAEGLQTGTAWIISAAFSFLIWLMFKLKIKGWKRSSAFYIGFCGIIFLILMLVSQLGDYPIFMGSEESKGIINLLLP